jgi:hypothetical protein
MNMGSFLEFETVVATTNVKVICPSFAQSGVKKVQHTFKIRYASVDVQMVMWFIVPFSLLSIVLCCHVSVSMCLFSS